MGRLIKLHTSCYRENPLWSFVNEEHAFLGTGVWPRWRSSSADRDDRRDVYYFKCYGTNLGTQTVHEEKILFPYRYRADGGPVYCTCCYACLIYDDFCGLCSNYASHKLCLAVPPVGSAFERTYSSAAPIQAMRENSLPSTVLGNIGTVVGESM
ncbi:hypothetical protein BDR06DRAFT_957193 [Suillus hirtellus]|nr:hypothetical protein BDR06DRAFT_957193 [Suillus hirtellus]